MLKSANLLHKCGLGDSDMNSTVEAKIIVKKCSNLLDLFIFWFKRIKKRKHENLIIPDQIMAKCGGRRCLGRVIITICQYN